jgi:hypothetical protein
LSYSYRIIIFKFLSVKIRGKLNKTRKFFQSLPSASVRAKVRGKKTVCCPLTLILSPVGRGKKVLSPLGERVRVRGE